MTKKEKEWVDWFTDEYAHRTQMARASGGELPLPEDRVPWDLIEEKGVELKVVKTNQPGWYDALRSKWAALFPKKWCSEHDNPPPPPPPKPPRNPDWYRPLPRSYW